MRVEESKRWAEDQWTRTKFDSASCASTAVLRAMLRAMPKSQLLL
jgi:hypothetical protein